MDRHSLDLLAFGKVVELAAQRTRSAVGREKALALTPLSDRAAIQEALDRTAAMIEALAAELPPPLDGLHDVRLWARRAELGVLLEIDQLLQVRDLLDLTARIVEYRGRLGDNFPPLRRLLEPVQDLSPVARLIDSVIDERGQVRDSASPELSQLRGQLRDFEAKIQAELRRLLRSAEIRKALSYLGSTVDGGHHVLPVAVNYRHVIPGIVHRTSNTGETLFIEPAKVAALSAEMAVLRHAEERAIRRVRRRLTEAIGQEARRILGSIHTLAELDLTCAKAQWARQAKFLVPALNDEGVLCLHNARHPLLLELFAQAAAPDPPREVVPITIQLGEEYHLLVVTGPNTGGKTVALKTAGLLTAMALAGLPIPAEPGSEVAVFDDILVDIGDEQSIEQSLSTFSGHITRIGAILRHGAANTLVLLDELGAGTDPQEGAALGRAILDELVRLKCRGMVTTHLGDLKTYAFSTPGVENAAVEFDVESLRPTYHLMVGQFGQSCALRIARRLNLPTPVLRRAEKYFKQQDQEKLGPLAQIQKLREDAERARNEALKATVQAKEAAETYRRKSAAIAQGAAVAAEVEKARATLRPGDEVRVARFDKSGLVKRVDHRRGLAAVTVGAVEWELPLEELIPMIKGATS